MYTYVDVYIYNIQSIPYKCVLVIYICSIDSNGIATRSVTNRFGRLAASRVCSAETLHSRPGSCVMRGRNHGYFGMNQSWRYEPLRKWKHEPRHLQEIHHSYAKLWTCLDFWNRRIFCFLLMPVDARWLCFTGDARRATRLGSALNSSSPRGEPSELRSTWRSSLEDSKRVRQPRKIYETMMSQTRPACDITRHDMTRHAWHVLNVPVLSKRCQNSC